MGLGTISIFPGYACALLLLFRSTAGGQEQGHPGAAEKAAKLVQDLLRPGVHFGSAVAHAPIRRVGIWWIEHPTPGLPFVQLVPVHIAPAAMSTAKTAH